MVGLRKIKYKKVKNFLTEDEVKLLKGYCTIRSRLRNNNFQEEKIGEDFQVKTKPKTPLDFFE